MSPRTSRRYGADPAPRGVATRVLTALLVLGLALLGTWAQRRPHTPAPAPAAAPGNLPTVGGAPIPDAAERAGIAEAMDVIARGPPYPHRQDGTVFQNREGRLPRRPDGYYREYTVRTPGEATRGARRLVRGADGDLWYTRDHYEHFERLAPP